MKASIGRKLVGLALATGLVLAACGGDNATSSGSEENEEGLTTVRLTSVPIASIAPVAWALDDGIFEEYGLDVQLQPSSGGAAGIAAMTAGSADIAVGNAVSAVLAYSEGLPITIVASGDYTVTETEEEASALMVASGSDVESVADLEDRRVAVSEIGGINYYYLRAILRQNGVDPDNVKYVAMPFPQMLGALEAGEVDAMTSVEPFTTLGVSSGDAQVLSYYYREVGGRVPLGVYAARPDWANENRDTVQAFVDALNEALARWDDPANREEYLAILAEFTQIDPALIGEVTFTDWDHQVDQEAFEGLVDVLVSESALQEPPENLDELFFDTSMAP